MTFITENNIANLYSVLIEFPVFDEYKLPPASKVDFVVVHDDTMLVNMSHQKQVSHILSLYPQLSVAIWIQL